MHVDLLFPSKYLKAADLQGKHVTVTIERINPRESLQMTKGRKEKKPVVYLKGKEKAWVLNKTNAKAIAKAWGTEINNWVGKQVVIMPTTTEFGGDTVDCLRVDVRATMSLAGKQNETIDEPAHDPATGEVASTDPDVSMSYADNSQAEAEAEFNK